MPSEQILDTVVLRVMSFALPDSIDIMLSALHAACARFPAEVYNSDEDDASLADDDPALSELARGIRYARRRANESAMTEQMRYRTWLENSVQLQHELEKRRLIVDPLTFDEIRMRDEIMNRYGIGRGEAACLILSLRYAATAVFVSSDRLACRTAQTLGIPYITLETMLEQWVLHALPGLTRIQALVQGMRAAKFGLKEDVLRRMIERS
jgi:hypothetical protein